MERNSIPLNGLANIYAFLIELKEKGRLEPGDLLILENQIFTFKAYIDARKTMPQLSWETYLGVIAISEGSRKSFGLDDKKFDLNNETGLYEEAEEFSTCGVGIDLDEIGFKPKKDEGNDF